MRTLNLDNTIKNVRNTKTRSAWSRGVQAYALDMLDDLRTCEPICDNIEKHILNGAPDWRAYSGSGCALIYNEDIVDRLFTPSERKKYQAGRYFDLLDIQARACYQAYHLIAQKSVWN